MLDHNNEKTVNLAVHIAGLNVCVCFQIRTELSAGDVASLFGHSGIASQLKKYKAVRFYRN